MEGQGEMLTITIPTAAKQNVDDTTVKKSSFITDVDEQLPCGKIASESAKTCAQRSGDELKYGWNRFLSRSCLIDYLSRLPLDVIAVGSTFPLI